MTKSGERAAHLFGPDTILALQDMLACLPRMSSTKKEAWLRAHGLVKDMDGLEVVIYGDVLAALRGDAQSVPALARPKTKDPWDELPRVTVGRK